MKPISILIARSTLLCLSLIPAAFAGPGGTYGPIGPNPNPYGHYDGGFGGGYVHDHNPYVPGIQPGNNYSLNRALTPYRPAVNINVVEPVRVLPTNRPYYDRGPIVTRPAIVVQPNRPYSNVRPILVHRPTYYGGNGIGNSGWYHGDWHNNWNKSLTTRPYAWSGWGTGWNGWNGQPTATVVSSPWRFGYWSYSNPYYAATAAGPSYFNYSQPIVASNITADASGQFYPQAVGQMTREQAMQIFDSARQAFFAGDLRAARGQIDQAIAALPGDTVLHEFRALVLFAERDYSAAAGAIYSVLSSGPGWDWTTMIGLYPNANIYTAQLRVLEDFCNANPGAANARFVLAYHYLTAGYADAAAEVFRQVLVINPRDSLSAQLLASLTGTGANQVAQLPQFGDQPISNQFLTGSWAASREDGSNFQLNLRNDGFYNWVFTQSNGVRQQLNGAYTLSDGNLVLQQDGQPAMVGQIYPIAANRFVFKLTGSDPNDPGLAFSR